VLAAPGRAIASSRQPGKCCDTGCTPASATTMVEMPPSRSKGKA
jgi:4-hydroxybutyryl-CoA dehydratase / vinylacetyl-CoA-Delta-isomerase